MGPASQASSAEALADWQAVSDGATLWRIGTTGRSAAAEGQFWALEHPLSLGYPAAMEYRLRTLQTQVLSSQQHCDLERRSSHGLLRQSDLIREAESKSLFHRVASGWAHSLVYEEPMIANVYAEAREIGRCLAADGLTNEAASLIDSIEAGSTGTEILMALSWNLHRIENSNQQGVRSSSAGWYVMA